MINETATDYENRMTVGNDNQTDQEYKLQMQLEVAEEARIKEAAHSVFEDGDLNEVIEGMTRKDWMAFAADILVEPEYIINILSENREVSFGTAKLAREIAIERIIEGMSEWIKHITEKY